MRVAVFDPGYILDELGSADSREGYPQPAFVKRKQASTPTLNLSGLSAHLVQVNRLFDTQRSPVGDDDMAIDCSEIDSVPCNTAIVRCLHRDIDAWAAGRQADRVALLKSRDPDFLVELKHMIRV